MKDDRDPGERWERNAAEHPVGPNLRSDLCAFYVCRCGWASTADDPRTALFQAMFHSHTGK